MRIEVITDDGRVSEIVCDSVRVDNLRAPSVEAKVSPYETKRFYGTVKCVRKKTLFGWKTIYSKKDCMVESGIVPIEPISNDDIWL